MDSVISIPTSPYLTDGYKTRVISTIKFDRPCVIHYDPVLFINDKNTLVWKDETHTGEFNLFCEKILNALKDYSKDFPCEGTIEWKGEDESDFGYYEIQKNGEWILYSQKNKIKYPSPWQEFED